MKSVLITGASGGLGKALSLHFAQKGWQVIGTAINDEERKNIEGIKNITCYTMDVTSTESIENAKQNILNDFKTIDVIINNAGMGYRSFVELSEDKKIDNIINVNLLGVVKVCRAFIPTFREQNAGQFINITSIAGLVNLPLGSFYHATKNAVESFSECMAYELMAFNIKVSTVQFGNAKTDFQKNVVKSDTGNIAPYIKLMEKIDGILHKKTAKNTDLLPKIVTTIYNAAEHPSKIFKRYTIGFDANFMKTLRALLGYKLFNFVIRNSTLN